MAIVATWAGDGLANGTVITTSTVGLGDTAFSAVSGASSGNITVSATGPRSPRLSFPALSSSTKFLRWYTDIIGTPTTYALRLYFEFADYGALSSTLARASNGGTDVWRVDIAGTGGSPPGEVRLRGAAGALLADSGTWGISTGTVYRLEVVSNSGAVTVKLYEGNSTTALTTLTASVASTIDTIDIGPAVTTSTSVQYFDSIAVSNTASEIGPIPPGVTVATNTAVTTTSSIAATLYSAVATGTTLIGTVGTENGPGGNPSLTVTDSKGNTYTVDKQISNGTTMSVSVFSGKITTALTTSDTITVTSTTSRTRWALTVQSFENIAATSRVDQSATNTGSSSSISVGPTPTTTAANELVYAGFCMGVRAFTPGSGYTGSVQIATTAGSTDRAINSEWKYVTSTGAQTANATLASSTSFAGAVVTYKLTAGSNTSPTANAGPDQTATVSSTVTLNGTGSSDPDGTIASYSWTQISGTAVTLSSSTASQPTFTAPSSPATLVFGLTVTDNLGATSTQDTVTISVQNKVGYVAEAATGLSTTSGTSFTANFAKSVQIGHTLLVGLVVDDTQNVVPALSVTDSQGNTYSVDSLGFRNYTMAVAVVSCYVTNALTATDTITVTSDTTRGRWVVSALEFDNIHQGGFDVAANMNGDPSTDLVSGTTPVTQDQVEVVFAAFGFGTGSNPTFSAGQYYQQAGTQHATAAASANRAVAAEYRIYTAPAAQQATASLSASAGYAGAIATYAADIIADIEPVADAGSDQSVAAFDTVTLDGSGSTDEDGVITDYEWAQTDGPSVELSSPMALQPTFTAPGTLSGTSVTFSLVVTDNLGEDSTNATEVTVTVNAAEQFIASSGSWQAVQEQSASGGSWS